MTACKVCSREFTPKRPLQSVCGLVCAKKVPAKARRTRQEALKTRSQWLREAQAQFNAWIRARDAQQSCICCGKWSAGESTGGDWDCGHYRSTGSAPHLRFDERNAHRQLKQCNRWGAGRAVDYRIGLIRRIGVEAVEALEADQTPKKYTIDDLKAIKQTYRDKLRVLQNEP